MTEANQSPYSLPSSLLTIDDVVHFAGVTQEYLSSIKDLPVKADDVFIASYPKSGTTWISEIVWQLFFDEKNDKRSIDERVLFLEILKLTGKVKTNKDLHDMHLKHPYPRIFKTHLRYHELPMGGGDTTKPKYIYVVRNPKDVVVSFYHHYKGIKLYEFAGRTWDEFFQLFMENKVHYGSWFDHVLGWWAHRHDDNVLLLKYEDMKKNLSCAVQQIAKFVGKDLSPEMIQRFADQTNFKAMSADQGRFLMDEEKVPDTNYKFIRKGEVGDWQNYFSEEQNSRFDELYQKKMAGSGLELEFSL